MKKVSQTIERYTRISLKSADETPIFSVAYEGHLTMRIYETTDYIRRHFDETEDMEDVQYAHDADKVQIDSKYHTSEYHFYHPMEAVFYKTRKNGKFYYNIIICQ